ncbi:tyrosine-type recombinase/integrase [Cellulosilyticum lentocellum]|uniref:Integrase family protein n=1 Tax=Cellulosilyticum lentocellum (strain ATCC 49066 / DSM 5427 / NCIMB 11756 / RHM5) TaxID=642492 RepID=F2JIG3_CELLD|nr:site-specific integrase [Cellulosilyticum lentocellum]ADZ84329.1 integrase family protein [Cellulosilyticum lentocellum DSM 5427]
MTKATQEKTRKKGQNVDGLYTATVDTGIRNANGTKKYKYFRAKTKKELKAKVDAYKMDVALNGKPLDKTTVTLSEWVYQFLFVHVIHEVAPTTFHRYVNLYEVHIKDSYIGDIGLQCITHTQIQRYFNNKTDKAKATLQKIKNLLNKAFKSAIHNNFIRYNPMDGIIIPKTAKEAKEIKILTTQEQLRYIEASKAEPNGLFLRLALYTGMRLGEVLALKWENVDLEQGTITVKESMKRSRVYSDDGNFIVEDVIKEPKTKKGIRLIYIPDILIEELKQIEKEDGLVFDTNESTVNHMHDRICTAAKINPNKVYKGETATTVYGVGIHALRHTLATRLLENNVNIKYVSDILGHKNITTTYNIYSHVLDDSKREVATTINQIFTY